MNYNFSSVQILGLTLSIVFVIISIITITKYFINKNMKFTDKINTSNIFRLRSTFLLFGFLISFIMIFIIFNWTTTAYGHNLIDYSSIIVDEIEIDIPITRDQPKKLPPPPPPIIELVPEDIILELDQPVFQTSDIGVDDIVEFPNEDLFDELPTELPFTRNKEEETEIQTFAEEMPLFPGCNGVIKSERIKCATKKLYQYIYNHLHYPSIAQETGIEGKVTLRFVVDKKGNISKVKVLRDIGGDCGNAAAKVIQSMNSMDKKWIPGKQSGRPVSVWFTLPVIFKLSD